jgi:hypothetical protein
MVRRKSKYVKNSKDVGADSISVRKNNFPKNQLICGQALLFDNSGSNNVGWRSSKGLGFYKCACWIQSR